MTDGDVHTVQCPLDGSTDRIFAEGRTSFWTRETPWLSDGGFSSRWLCLCRWPVLGFWASSLTLLSPAWIYGKQRGNVSRFGLLPLLGCKDVKILKSSLVLPKGSHLLHELEFKKKIKKQCRQTRAPWSTWSHCKHWLSLYFFISEGRLNARWLLSLLTVCKSHLTSSRPLAIRK
jgi:hypothetical protein